MRFFFETLAWLAYQREESVRCNGSISILFKNHFSGTSNQLAADAMRHNFNIAILEYSYRF
jgi:hypothetical protein